MTTMLMAYVISNVLSHSLCALSMPQMCSKQQCMQETKDFQGWYICYILGMCLQQGLLSALYEACKAHRAAFRLAILCHLQFINL